MKTINILIPMDLAGQAKRQRDGERGYAMAALLVAPDRHGDHVDGGHAGLEADRQREKEEELVFRGKQYVHAIGLFQRKFANAYPPNIDVLVDQRFLRKKFKDPITNDDFVPIPAGQAVPGTHSRPAVSAARRADRRPRIASAGPARFDRGRGRPATGQQTTSTQPGAGASSGPPISAGSTGQTSGGIQGVTSKSKDQSIRLYNGRGHYNEWAFVYIQQQQAAGAGARRLRRRPVPADSAASRRSARSVPRRPAAGTARTRPAERPRRAERSGRGGFGTFGGGGVTPIQPPSTPRGRF